MNTPDTIAQKTAQEIGSRFCGDSFGSTSATEITRLILQAAKEINMNKSLAHCHSTGILVSEEDANKETDVFVGMWRPPFHEVEARYADCTIGYFPGSDALREAYLNGEFDQASYRRIVNSSFEIKDLSTELIELREAITQFQTRIKPMESNP